VDFQRLERGMGKQFAGMSEVKLIGDLPAPAPWAVRGAPNSEIGHGVLPHTDVWISADKKALS